MDAGKAAAWLSPDGLVEFFLRARAELLPIG
jgi:hypothetical protein